MKKNLLAFFALLSVGLSQAQVGNSLNFDGSNDNIRRAVVSTQSTGVTFEARIRAVAPSAGNKFIMYNGTNGTNGFGMYLQALTNTVVVKVGSAVYTTSYAVTPSTLTLLSVVFTGPNSLQVYANGVMVHNFFPTPAATPSGSFAIGSDDAGANFFPGDIDEVRYWDRIVCPAEIAHRANCQAAGYEPLLVACYNFNQGVGSANNSTVTTLMDATANNYTATLVGFGLSGASSNWVTLAGGYSTTCTFAPNTVTVTNTPTAAVCAGNAVTLTATGATSYTWSTLTTGSTAVVNPTAATTTYSVVGVNGICIVMGTQSVATLPLPTVAISSSTNNLCIGSTATLTATGASTFAWMPSGSGPTIAISPSVNTTYTAVGTGTNGCSSQTVYTQAVQNCATGLVQLNGAGDLRMYPNPTSGVINIDLGSLSNINKVEIYNAIGQKVLSTDISEKISIEHLPNGVYFVRLKEDNTIVKTAKLIKE